MKNLTISLNERDFERLKDKIGSMSLYSYLKTLIVNDLGSEPVKGIINNPLPEKPLFTQPQPSKTKRFCKHCSGVREFKNDKCVVCKNQYLLNNLYESKHLY